MREQHEGDARGEHTGQGKGVDDAPGCGRRAEDGLRQGRGGEEARPYAPFATFGDAAQQAKQHDHAQCDHDGGSGQSVHGRGCVVGRTQLRCEPRAGHPFELYIDGNGVAQRVGQGEDVASFRRLFLPFDCLCGPRSLGDIDMCRTRQVVAEVEQ